MKNIIYTIILICVFSLIFPCVAKAQTYDSDTDIHVNIKDSVTPDNKDDEAVIINAINRILERYRIFIVGILGACCLTSVAGFLFHLFMLGKSGNVPRDRKQATTGLLVCGIATALLGGSTVFFGLFFNLLK